MISKNTWVAIKEEKRTYVSNDRRYVIEKPVKLMVSESGTHYVECEDGSKFIVIPFWDIIKIEGEWLK